MPTAARTQRAPHALLTRARSPIGPGLLLAALDHALLKHQLETPRARLCEATCGRVDARQLDLSARVVRRQSVEAPPGPILAPAAHLAAQLCDELLRAGKTGGPSRDALWTRAVIHTAECALSVGDVSSALNTGALTPLALAAALTFFNFERHTPKTAPQSKQVAEAAGIQDENLMAAYMALLPFIEVGGASTAHKPPSTASHCRPSPSIALKPPSTALHLIPAHDPNSIPHSTPSQELLDASQKAILEPAKGAAASLSAPAPPQKSQHAQKHRPPSKRRRTSSGPAAAGAAGAAGAATAHGAAGGASAAAAAGASSGGAVCGAAAGGGKPSAAAPASRPVEGSPAFSSPTSQWQCAHCGTGLTAAAAAAAAAGIPTLCTECLEDQCHTCGRVDPIAVDDEQRCFGCMREAVLRKRLRIGALVPRHLKPTPHPPPHATIISLTSAAPHLHQPASTQAHAPLAAAAAGDAASLPAPPMQPPLLVAFASAVPATDPLRAPVRSSGAPSVAPPLPTPQSGAVLLHDTELMPPPPLPAMPSPGLPPLDAFRATRRIPGTPGHTPPLGPSLSLPTLLPPLSMPPAANLDIGGFGSSHVGVPSPSAPTHTIYGTTTDDAATAAEWERPLNDNHEDLYLLLSSPARPSTPSHSAPPPYPLRHPTPPNASPLHAGGPPTLHPHPFAMLRLPPPSPHRGPSPRGEQRAMVEWAVASARHQSPAWRAPSPAWRAQSPHIHSSALGGASPHHYAVAPPPSAVPFPLPLPLGGSGAAPPVDRDSVLMPPPPMRSLSGGPADINLALSSMRTLSGGPGDINLALASMPDAVAGGSGGAAPPYQRSPWLDHRPSTDPRSSPAWHGPSSGCGASPWAAFGRPSTDPRSSPAWQTSSISLIGGARAAGGLPTAPGSGGSGGALSGSVHSQSPLQSPRTHASSSHGGSMLPPPPRCKGHGAATTPSSTTPPPADSTLTDLDIQSFLGESSFFGAPPDHFAFSLQYGSMAAASGLDEAAEAAAPAGTLDQPPIRRAGSGDAPTKPGELPTKISPKISPMPSPKISPMISPKISPMISPMLLPPSMAPPPPTAPPPSTAPAPALAADAAEKSKVTDAEA